MKSYNKLINNLFIRFRYGRVIKDQEEHKKKNLEYYHKKSNQSFLLHHINT